MSLAWHRSPDQETAPPDTDSLRTREGGENFPVALRVLPSEQRGHLHTVYAFARLVDETGDSAPGDRTAQLLELDARLEDAWDGGAPEHSVLGRLARCRHDCDLSTEPFHRLVRANLQDQEVHRYETFEELLGYCELSANPIGRTVLEIFGQCTPETLALSDRVCTALQLLEHWQDVAEDHRAGRVYLPQEDLRAWGVAERDLAAPAADPSLRGLVLAETARAAALLEEGTDLVNRLHGWGRVSVAGFVAGGQATAAALRRSGGDVLARSVRPGGPTTLTRLLLLLAGRGAARR